MQSANAASTASERRTLSVDEASTELGISPWLVRKLVTAGKINHVRLGRRIRIAASEIARILNETPSG